MLCLEFKIDISKLCGSFEGKEEMGREVNEGGSQKLMLVLELSTYKIDLITYIIQISCY